MLSSFLNRFNTGPDQVENSIVTSSGNYVVAWDFTRVKQGKKDKYNIKQYEEEIVSDDFVFGDNNDIVSSLVPVIFRHLLNPSVLYRWWHSRITFSWLIARSLRRQLGNRSRIPPS